MLKVKLASLLALLAVPLALPGVAAASSAYQVSVLTDHCQYTGGAHGRGYVELKVKAREIGMSGVNYFLVLSERQASSGLAFSTQSTWPKEYSDVFPNNAANYYHVTDRRYDFTRNDEITNRLVITVKFKNQAGEVFAKRKVIGQGC